MHQPLPPALVVPTSAADRDTLLPPEDYDEPCESDWIPAAPYWNAAPTMPLPPPPREYPVPIPVGLQLIPTDVLPPALLDVVIPELPSSIPPPPLLGAPTLASPPPSEYPDEPASIAPEPVAPPPTASAFEPISLEQCATIEALMALHPKRSVEILAEHNTDESSWTLHFTHWQHAIRTALHQDDASLLAQHDDAFIAALERNRGAVITAEDHAAIVASARRGTRAETLRALRIPTSAVARVERVMLRRLGIA